jgi:cholesterol oxidase
MMASKRGSSYLDGLSRDAYEAVVIGSGFGGAVATCRLAQAGVDVALIERGRRFPLGDFPRHVAGRESLLWHHGGPYDIRPLNDVLVVQAAGYGGGSLVYANVQMRPRAVAFGDGWPTGYSRATLDPYYDLVGYMLDVQPVQANPATGEVPSKTRLMEEAAARLGRSAQFFRPNLAVRFEGSGALPTPNKFGAPQSGCIHCGECDIGCNVGAKNTLDLNYLTLAESSGAQVTTRSEVTWLAPDEKEGYQIRFRDHEANRERTIAARLVFLCMGAVNTTEFLLRCRDQHETLPHLSPKLGSGYSANGDLLAFALGATSFEATRGPTITTAGVYDTEDRDSRLSFTIEDGGFAEEIAHAMPLLHPFRLARLAGRALEDQVKHHAHSFAELLETEAESTAVLLAMGKDRADGTIELAHPHHRLHVRWDAHKNLELYAAETAACRELADALGGSLALAPNWRFLGQPSTVHNLGGCPMASHSNSGVVDSDGAVFGYPGLHVLDGAIIPGAVGVNPSHTIAAVAERCVQSVIRRLPGSERWSAPEAAHVSRLNPPEDRVSIPQGGTSRPAVRGGALRWRESMRGSLTIDGIPKDARFDIAITISDVKSFVADPAHPGRVTGRIEVEGLTEFSGATVESGTFHLFIEGSHPRERLMAYALPFRSPDGSLHELRGLKHVSGHRVIDFWRATTTLEAELEPRAGRGVTAGRLSLGVFDVARLIASMRSVRGSSRSDPLTAMWQFVRFYAATVIKLYFAGRKARRRGATE